MVNNLEYSEDTVKLWLFHRKEKLPEKEAIGRYTKCISRLIDVIRTGRVSRCHLNSERTPIPGESHEFLENYIEWIRDDISPGSVKTHRWAVLLLLRFAHSQKVDLNNEFSVSFFEDFIDFLKSSNIEPHQVSPFLVKFAEYLELHGMIEKEMHWFFHDYPRIKRINDYSDSFLSCFEEWKTVSGSLPLSDYRNMVSSTLAFLEENQYMSAVIITSERTFRLLYFFLCSAGLPYHPATAETWIYESKDIFQGAWYMARRALDILAAVATDSIVGKRGSAHPKYIIPEWAADIFHTFIQMKIKERYEQSTVNMYRICISRFLVYLDSAGIRSYSDITPHVIHAFNRDDKHDTNYSKNAYNCRIRSYLEYLEINKITAQPGLPYSLAKARHYGERFIDVLSSEEVEEIERYAVSAKTPIELRNAAAILLSLKMGLRLSDVVNLELDNIDWQEKSIRFTQIKTHREMHLPMPVEVGNAIYAYLLKGRPRDIKSTKVFVSTNKPYGPVSGDVLRKALKKVLPGRNVPRSGFHVLRRTFSTITMNSGNTPAMVAELLGHSNPGNTHKYLSMDAVHMKQCPLSFDEAGIGEICYGR